ncbi:MAG TPA: Plug domain-containing protein [Gemmatimonadaceae bacterium]|nr:Plug domain-containing protein [Gemmatimonadaceae bacterium]
MSRILAGLCLALVCACNWKSQPAAPRGSSDILTSQEIAATPVDNAYDAVQRLRPEFLRERPTGFGALQRPTVFINGIRRGGVEILRTISTTTISEIRYLSAPEASSRYGMDVVAGVIDVTVITR